MRAFERPALLAISLLASILAFSQANTWKEYIYAEDGFAVSSPVEPSLVKQVIKPVAGEVEAHFYFIPLEHCKLMLMYGPLHPNDQRTPEQALQDSKMGITITKGKLISEKSISFGAYPGLELETEDGQHRQRGRIYVIDRKVYVLAADVPIGQQFPGEVQRWYDSFRLISAKK